MAFRANIPPKPGRSKENFINESSSLKYARADSSLLSGEGFKTLLRDRQIHPVCYGRGVFFHGPARVNSLTQNLVIFGSHPPRLTGATNSLPPSKRKSVAVQ